MVQDGGNSLADGGDDRVTARGQFGCERQDECVAQGVKGQDSLCGDEHEASLGDGVDALRVEILTRVTRKLPMSKGKREYKPVIYKLTSPSGKAYIGHTVRPKRVDTHAASGRARKRRREWASLRKERTFLANS